MMCDELNNNSQTRTVCDVLNVLQSRNNLSFFERISRCVNKVNQSLNPKRVLLKTENKVHSPAESLQKIGGEGLKPGRKFVKGKSDYMETSFT